MRNETQTEVISKAKRMEVKVRLKIKISNFPLYFVLQHKLFLFVLITYSEHILLKLLVFFTSTYVLLGKCCFLFFRKDTQKPFLLMLILNLI